MRMLGRILACLVLLVVALAAAGGLVWTRYNAGGPSAQATAVVIPRGAGLEEVASRLAAAGLVGARRRR